MEFICQIIYLCLFAIALLLGAHEHGKPKVGLNNFWIVLIGVIVEFSLLFFGGFFTGFFR